MRVEELLNTKPLVINGDSAAANISPTTKSPRKTYKAYEPLKAYKPCTGVSKADSTARKMRLKEFLLRYDR